VLKIIQGRDPEWTNRVFFARFDSTAAWFDELEPAFGDEEFFFSRAIRSMYAGNWQPEWAEIDEDEDELSA
jgi:hypothetical protein